MDCLFCKIATNEIQAPVVYENKDVIAFLDKFPLAAGHVLILPKEHHVNIFDIPEETLSAISAASKTLAIKIKNGLAVEGITIWQNNEPAGGQSIMHYHIHLIPRWFGDRFGKEVASQSSKIQEKANLSASEINNIRNKIRNA